MDKREYKVHISHCCIKHGCKYGDKDCPVINGEVKQEYICEECDDDNIHNISELFERNDVIRLKEIFNGFDEAYGEDNSNLLRKIEKLINKEYPYIFQGEDSK